MNLFSTNKMLIRVAVPVAATALLASACSSSGTKGTYAPRSSAATSGAVNGTAAETVRLGHGRLGDYLTDGSGRAVYVFDSDTPTESTCIGVCATEWPPVLATGSLTATGGASAADLATIDRPGGGKQVTYAGHPLYYFADDEKAGQTHGQGLDDFGAKWWLLAPSGRKITGAASASSSSGGYAGGGY